MKRTILSLAALVLLLASPALSAREIITSTSFTLKGTGEIKIEKFFENGEAGIKITNDKGETLLEQNKLGTADKKFMFGGKPVNLALKDITGDGAPEVLTAFYSGYKSSCLYVYTFDEKEKKFKAIDFMNKSDSDLTTDFVPSDIYQESGSDIVVNDDGSLAILGTIYPKNAKETSTAGVYTFKYDKDAYNLVSTVPVPED